MRRPLIRVLFIVAFFGVARLSIGYFSLLPVLAWRGLRGLRGQGHYSCTMQASLSRMGPGFIPAPPARCGLSANALTAGSGLGPATAPTRRSSGQWVCVASGGWAPQIPRRLLRGGGGWEG